MDRKRLEILGRWIKSFRISAGIDEKTMAEILRIPLADYLLIEEGDEMLSEDNVRDICNVLIFKKKDRIEFLELVSKAKVK